jgi:two-component system response regulator HydG
MLRAARDANQSIIVGGSAAMRKVADLIDRVGDSDASVLIHGETGTGKELVARAVHNKSKRRDGPFVAINCAAVPHSLLESELFGHARGAFTDAKSTRMGLFQQANGGSLFLDEIGELPIDVQPKLLRALQERKVRPVGDNREIAYDARIVAATNRDLENEVREKRFREDLYYRINVVKLEVPPLRARGSDTLHLAHYFLKQVAERSGKPTLELSERAAERLMAYEWPGNVRELENCIEHAVALARFDQVTVEDLPEKLRGYLAGSFVATANDPTEIVTMEELEKRYLLRVFKLVGNNKSRAAEVLGIDRRTMYRKLERYASLEGAESGAPGTTTAGARAGEAASPPTPSTTLSTGDGAADSKSEDVAPAPPPLS